MGKLSRQSPRPSLPPNLRDRSIAFKHPHYPEPFGQNIIFSLQGYDSIGHEEETEDDTRGGLHYGTALVACGIVAGNAWNGYFTVERQGQKLDMRNDQLLTGPAFYFHVPLAGESSAYAVCPSFDRWAFPHGNLPAAWTQLAGSSNTPNVPVLRSNVTAAVLQRDNACALTGQRDYMEKAHLCPISEGDWFRINRMSQYNANNLLSSDYITDDITNAIALRSDIHIAFDDRTFIFVPKEESWSSNLTGEYRPTIYCLDLHGRYFLWSRDFSSPGGKRIVKFRVFEEDGHKEKTEAMSAGAIRSTFFSLYSRSQSPKKQKGPDSAQEHDVQVEWEGGHGREAKRRRCSDNEDGFRKGSPRSIASLSDTRWQARTPHDEDDDDDDDIGSMPPIIDGGALDTIGEQAWQAGEEAFEKYIARLRRRQLVQNRPKNPLLYCCDYTRADALTRRGVLGERKWGGSHLCAECLGGEYVPLAEVDNEEKDE